jgi:hypothetical protein
METKVKNTVPCNLALSVTNRYIYTDCYNTYYCTEGPLYINTGWSKRLCTPANYSTKNMQKYFKQFQSLTMITQLELWITNGISVRLMSINVWRLAGDTLNITCNFLYCNNQVHRYVLINLYNVISICPRNKVILQTLTIMGYLE